MNDSADLGELSRFKRAQALVITWEGEDDAQKVFKAQAEELANQLKKQEDTGVEYFKIGPVKSKQLTYDRLKKFLDDNDGEGNLLIIYYGGHAAVNKDEELVWSPWVASPTTTLHFKACLDLNLTIAATSRGTNPTESTGTCYKRCCSSTTALVTCCSCLTAVTPEPAHLPQQQLVSLSV